MKKVASIFLAAAMALTMGGVTAFAASDVAETGGVKYATVQQAIDNAQPNGTVTLLTSVEEDVTIQKDITLDLGGFTLSRKGKTVMDIYAHVQVKNGTVLMTGGNNGSAVWVNGNGGLTIAKDAIIAARESAGQKCFAVAYWSDCNGADVTLDGTIAGELGITTNGMIKTDNTLHINDGAVIDVEETAIYQAGKVNTTIGKATITGGTGIEVRAGKVTIDGAVITATHAFAEAPNGGGTTVEGAAVAVSQHTTNQPIEVVIAGGSFKGEKALYEKDLQDAAGTDSISITVNGGAFSGAVQSQNVAGFVAAGSFDAKVDANYIAGGKASASLQSEQKTTYYIGTAEDVAKTLTDKAKQGDTIAVQQGDIALANVAEGVTITNEGEGNVTVDGAAVEKGQTTVTKPAATPAPTEQPTTTPTVSPTPDLPKTGEHGTALPMMLFIAGAGVLVASLALRKRNA